jgi:hypothetical protein
MKTFANICYEKYKGNEIEWHFVATHAVVTSVRQQSQ